MSTRFRVIGYLMMFLVFGTNSFGKSACPDWILNRTNDIPTCPQGGLVPETHPLAAIVVSDTTRSGKNSDFAAEVVEKVLNASGNNNPLLLLVASDDTIALVKRRIDKMPISLELKNKYKKSIVDVPASGYPWQQDYFQPFSDPMTGKIVLREIQGYGRDGYSFGGLAEAARACGFQTGPVLSNKKFVDAHMGGNIETLPEGICVIGEGNFQTETDWKSYADQICNPGSENRIKAPTSWLRVGHSDEVIRIVRNKKAQAPCDFSILIASPRKAIELLKQSPDSIFLNFKYARTNDSSKVNIWRGFSNLSFRDLCKKAMDLRRQSKPIQDDKEDTGIQGKGVTKNMDWFKFLVEEAVAGLGGGYGPDSKQAKECASLTNGDVYNVSTKNEETKIFNQLIQEKMDQLKIEVSQKLGKKLPQCSLDFIEAPNLFSGGRPVEVKKGEYELPKKMATSILPNTVNAISVNDTVISPDPSNEAFLKYYEEQYQKRGLKTGYIDTYNFAHLLGGNLHCATNTIHICNPRGQP